MASGVPAGSVVYVVTAAGESSILNRQQLLGSMPKMLDALSHDESITIEPVEQSLFTRALLAVREATD